MEISTAMLDSNAASGTRPALSPRRNARSWCECSRIFDVPLVLLLGALLVTAPCIIGSAEPAFDQVCHDYLKNEVARLHLAATIRPGDGFWPPAALVYEQIEKALNDRNYKPYFRNRIKQLVESSFITEHMANRERCLAYAQDVLRSVLERAE